MSLVRSLKPADAAAIEHILKTRSTSLIGVNWTRDSILSELSQSSSIGFFNPCLRSFVLYKTLGSVIEILLIISQNGVPGAAREVFKALVDAYGQHGQGLLEEVWLEVHEDNQSAIRFYENLGFEKVSTRRSYYPDGKSALNYNLRVRK